MVQFLRTTRLSYITYDSYDCCFWWYQMKPAGLVDGQQSHLSNYPTYSLVKTTGRSRTTVPIYPRKSNIAMTSGILEPEASKHILPFNAYDTSSHTWVSTLVVWSNYPFKQKTSTNGWLPSSPFWVKRGANYTHHFAMFSMAPEVHKLFKEQLVDLRFK